MSLFLQAPLMLHQVVVGIQGRETNCEVRGAFEEGPYEVGVQFVISRAPNTMQHLVQVEVRPFVDQWNSRAVIADDGFTPIDPALD